MLLMIGGRPYPLEVQRRCFDPLKSRNFRDLGHLKTIITARFNAPIFEHKKRLSSVHFSFCAFHPFGRALLPGR